MILFPVLIFIVELVLSNAGVIPEVKKTNTFYDALELKCPLVKEAPEFKNQKIFDKCTDWTKINETQNLTEDTENNFLCLLYYDSLSLFCSEITQVAPENRPNNINSYFTPAKAEYKVETICRNLSLFPTGKKLEHNVTQWLKSDIQCVKLCSSYTGTTKTECNLAYYFANLLVKPAEPKKAEEGKTGSIAQGETKLVKTDQHELPVEDNKAKKGDKSENNQAENVPKVAPGETQDTVKALPSVVADGAEAVQTSEKEKPATQKDVKPEVKSVDQPPVSSSTKGSTALLVETNPKETDAKKVEDTAKVDKSVVEEETLNHPEDNLDPNGAVPEMEVESPSVQQVEPDLENPDDNSPLELDNDDDEEQQYKKEEQEAYKEEKEAKDKLNADENPNVDTQDKKGDLKQGAVKDTKTVVMVPDNIPISSANATDIDGESYFFSYFMAICVLFVLGYVGYHNRQKVMALMVEGKRGKRQYRGRRPNSANYHKLDSNLEEAISSTCTKNSSHVIY